VQNKKIFGAEERRKGEKNLNKKIKGKKRSKEIGERR